MLTVLSVIFILQVADPNREFFVKTSELFESPVYLEEVADVLCILQAGDYSYRVWGGGDLISLIIAIIYY